MAAERLERIGAALRKRWWIFAALAFVFAAYSAAGFLLVPRLARGYIESYVEKDLARHVRIGELSFNPFNFSTEIRDFALTEADGSPLAGFAFLRVDFQTSSLFNRAWTFKEIRLERPDISLIVNTDGSLNLAKLKPADTAPAANPAPAAIPAIRIGTLSVIDGRVGVADRSRGQPFATTLTPIEFTLTDFRTAPDFQNEYRFEAATVAGERLVWSGRFSVQPLGSTGTFSVTGLKTATIESYLQNTLPFHFSSGSLDLEGGYRAAITDRMGFSVELSALKLHDIGVAPKAAANSAPWISFPEVALSQVAYAFPEQKLSIDRIDIDNAKLSVWREANGAINLLQLLPQASANAAASAAGPTPAMDISVGTIAIRAASIAAEDRTTRPAAKFALAPVTATITGYSTDAAKAIALDASLTVNGKGRAAAKGDVRLSPLTANLALDVQNVELPPLQPYVAAVSGVQLLSGQFTAKGDLAINPAPPRGQSGLRLTGNVTVANLATRDTALRQDFIKWQRLQLTGIDFRQGPDSLAIDRIRAQRPYGKVVISEDQQVNIAAVLSPPRNARTPARAQPPAPSRPMPIRIRQVTVQDGRLDFADFSIQPNFAAVIGSLGGTVTGLSSAPDTRAEVKLAGTVDSYAPVDISGQINLLSAAVFSDIAMNFRNMELTTFNPYSGKYAGYNISKGKLTTELHYKVENRALDAQHHIVLDQLEFGQATGSKDAVPLPVRLAVALLKDRDGVIDLNLPVSGSLDDPEFRLGPIIWKAFIGLLTKIVEAPFAVIGSLFGGGEDLAYVDFAPGSAMLTTENGEKLANLAKGLAERPQLRLDIPLMTLVPADDAALADVAFTDALAPLLPEVAPGGSLAPQQRLAALAQLYEQQLGMKPVYPMPPMPDADPVPGQIAFLEEALRPRFPATQARRDALARARADAVRGAVLNQEGVAPERVFLSERQSGPGAPMGVRMELNLE